MTQYRDAIRIIADPYKPTNDRWIRPKKHSTSAHHSRKTQPPSVPNTPAEVHIEGKPATKDNVASTEEACKTETGELARNKGFVPGNLEASEMMKRVEDNTQKMERNVRRAGVEVSDFKPGENKVLNPSYRLDSSKGNKF